VEAAGVSNLHHLFHNLLILLTAYPGLAQKKHPTWGVVLGILHRRWSVRPEGPEMGFRAKGQSDLIAA